MNQYTQDDQRQREETDKGQKAGCSELDISIDPTSVAVESVEALHGSRDHHDKYDDYESIEDFESDRHRFVPSEMRMSCSKNPLCKNEVDDEQQDDAGAGEDLGSNCYPNIRRSCSPDDAHHHRYHSSHRETKHQG